MPVLGPVFGIFILLLRELLIFGIFFFLQAFMFAIVGTLIFNDRAYYSTITTSLLTIFKASAGYFNQSLLF